MTLPGASAVRWSRAEHLRFGRLRYWLGKGIATLLDQGLTSASNFMLGLFLARALGPEQYGIYALVYSGFLLMANSHQALLLEPMTIFAPAYTAPERRHYVARILTLHGAFSLLCVPIVTAIAAWMSYDGQTSLAMAAMALIIVIPCVLFLWVMRCAAYVECAPAWATRASVLYCVLLLAQLAVIWKTGSISPFVTFCTMASSAFVAGSYLFFKLRPAFGGESSIRLRDVIRKQSAYGAWSLIATGLLWVQHNTSFLLAGYFLGMRETGALGAVLSFTLPMTHVVMASSRLIVPRLASQFAAAGAVAIRSRVVLLAGGFGTAALLYWVTLLFSSDIVLPLLYGPKFAAFSYAVPLALVSVVLWAAMFPFEMGLRVIRKPSKVVLSYSVSSAVVVATAWPAVHWAGLDGLLIALALANATGLVMCAWMLLRATGRVEKRDNVALTAVEGAS